MDNLFCQDNANRQRGTRARALALRNVDCRRLELERRGRGWARSPAREMAPGGVEPPPAGSKPAALSTELRGRYTNGSADEPPELPWPTGLGPRANGLCGLLRRSVARSGTPEGISDLCTGRGRPSCRDLRGWGSAATRIPTLRNKGGGRDSNPRPPGPQPGALPTELPPPRGRERIAPARGPLRLPPRGFCVPSRPGLEPLTQ